VRLRQGRAEDATVYGDDPVAMARQWEERGATYLHVVDLDGAFQGRPAHLDVIRRIVAALHIPVEVGGGLRTDADIAAVLDGGAARAILGTRALGDPAELQRLIRRHGAGLAIGIDARGGLVQVKGWVETTAQRAEDLARRVDAMGAATIIYTDTATDGMLGGPNLEAVAALCRAVRCGVIASGGVSRVEDIRHLRALGCANLTGAIVGKALYDGRVTLAELRKAV